MANNRGADHNHFERKGGYPAGRVDRSQIKPPPTSAQSGQSTGSSRAPSGNQPRPRRGN